MRARWVVSIAAAATVIGLLTGVLLFGNDEPVSVTTGAMSSTTTSSTILTTSVPATTSTTVAATYTTTASTESTTAPSVTRDSQPNPKKGVVTKSRGTVLLGGRLTLHLPKTWEEKESDNDSATLVDKSGCSASCPKVSIFYTAMGPNRIRFRDDPLEEWASDVCHGHGTDIPGSFTTGGERGILRSLSCEGRDFFAWWVPDQKVLVTTQDADGIIRTDAVTSVLERAVWN